jgi:hypothetical protein
MILSESEIESKILIPLTNGEYVSRWVIALNKKQVLPYLLTEKYKQLADFIQDEIESCLESL